MSFSFSTLIAQIKNYFSSGAVGAKIKTLEAGVEADFDRAATAAQNAYVKGLAEVKTLAHDEAARVDALLQAAKARAAALLKDAEQHLHPTVKAQVAVTASIGETVH